MKSAMTVPPNPGVMPFEQAAIAHIFERRRLQSLRLILPSMAFLVVIYAALAHPPWNSGTQGLFAIVVAVFLLAGGATLWQRPTLATTMLIIGSLLIIGDLVFLAGPAQGQFILPTALFLFLFVLPTILAGMLSGTIMILLSVVLGFSFSLGVIQLTPLSPEFQALLRTRDATFLLGLPLLVQIGVGLLLFAGTFGVQRMQGELADLRIAYAREKGLEQLREQFISSVNHELRSPIMAIQGYFSLAKELGKRGNLTAQQEMLTRGEEVSDHLSHLVQSILAVRRLREATASFELHPIALAPLCAQACHTVALNAVAVSGGGEERFHIQVDTSATVMADEERLLEVLTNLLSNAVKYSPPATPITLTARRATPAQRRLLAKDQSAITISVHDQGDGIPPEQAVHIFDPFVRLQRDEESGTVGSGLGLAICRANIVAMHGHIWVESTGLPGKGATFMITLPAA